MLWMIFATSFHSWNMLALLRSC